MTSPAPPRRRWFCLRAIFMLSVLLSVLWLGHGMTTGIGVPYPDPTPEQAVYERYHWQISDWLLGTSLFGWTFTAIVAVVAAVRRLFRRRPTQL